MARSIKVVAVSKPRTPWLVAVPADVTGSKRIRRYFRDREKALAYVVALKQQGFLGAEGQASNAAGKVTLGECAALWIARHQQARVTFYQVRNVLNRLVARHGRDAIDAVGHRELDAWLRSLNGLSPVSVHNHFRITRRFFGWCQDFLEVIPRNPMKRLQERRLEHQEPAILTPDQMAACLEAANSERRLTAYLALGGFAGMRTQEIVNQRWDDIDWAAGEIYVRQPKRVGGWRPRHVEILPALRRHLEHLARGEGKVLSGGQQTLYELRRAMMNGLGWKTWPRNCLRHSFKTYHAAHFRDLHRLMLEMGHADSGLTHYVYGTPATRANAAAWWAL